jgi:DNA repair protein RecO (recombination protein O)
MTHNTRGIVLRTVKYGDTSIITTIYTELFGIQSYIVKGIRVTGKKGQSKAGYFQPGAILQLSVYHNELKHLQFIKEYHWHHIYQAVFFDVVKNAVALFIIELLQHSLKQPEANPDLYEFTEETLVALDTAPGAITANLPIYFIVQLARYLGFEMQGMYAAATPILDLQEGGFTADLPSHQQTIEGIPAQFISRFMQVTHIHDLEQLQLNQQTRRELVQACIRYFTLHIADFTALKSMQVLQEVMGNA